MTHRGFVIVDENDIILSIDKTLGKLRAREPRAYDYDFHYGNYSVLQKV